MFQHSLVKTAELVFGGQAYPVRYFESKTTRGALRYSSELLLGPADRIIFDGNSLTELELKVAKLVPATIVSRLLVARPG
jgi:hypothetical protein